MRPVQRKEDYVIREVADKMIGRYQTSNAIQGQIIARLAEQQGGSWRVIECGTCINDDGLKALFIEILLPYGPKMLIPLHNENVITTEIGKEPMTPRDFASDIELKSYIQGISYVGNT